MTMTLSVPLKILLVEDDEDDYLITQELIQEIIEVRQSASVAPQFELEWVKTYESALELTSLRCYLRAEASAKNQIHSRTANFEGH